MQNYESNLYRSLLHICHRFWSVALFLQEFRIAGVPSKIRTFQIVAYKLKWFTLFDFWMFAASAECLLNNLLSRICLLRYFKHNEIKISKTHFFQMASRIYYCTGRKFFWQAFELYEVCIVESENLGCYAKIAKFGAIFPLKRQYKNLVGLTKDNHTIWSLHKDESTNKTVFNN
jgi:hypothetical protein